MRTLSLALILTAVVSCASSEPRVGRSGQTPTASLASAIAVARQQAPEAEPRRIWAEQDTDGSGTPSPDGTLLSYSAWANGALAVRNLTTGENRLLTPTSSFGDRGFAESSAFSSDGKQLAYRWAEKGHDLRVVDVAGSEPRIVVPKSADVVTIVPLQWTADNREILVAVARADRSLQLAYANVATGALRGIRSFAWGPSGSACAALSRDGRYLAVSVPAGLARETETDVAILTREGSQEVERFKSPGTQCIVGWAADGRLFYRSARPGSVPSLFAVQTRDGRLSGAPQLVKSDMSRVLYPRITSDGRLFYEILSGSFDVYVAAVDVANARVLSPPARATHRLVGFNQGIDWTADGRYAAYLVREGAAPRSRGVVAIRDEQSGDVRELRPELEYINASIRWAPDGSAILAQATDMKARTGIFSIDARSGRITPILYVNPKGGVVHRPQWTPDAKSIYYASLDPDYPAPRIVHRQVESGVEREVYTSAQLRSIFALRDDGKMLAVIERAGTGSVIILVPTAGEPSRELLRLPERVASVTWSRDGRYVLFSKTPQTADTELWRVSLETGVASSVGLAVTRMSNLRMHPDGRRVGYTGGVAQAEIWVMETSAKAKADSTR